jgi:hypothetical protein
LLASQEYSRGIDLKFSEPTLVVVILTKAEVKYTEFLQMMGRSSRNQGQGQGLIFCLKEKLEMNATIIELIKTRGEVQNREGGGNLKAFYDWFPRFKRDQVIAA